MAKERVVWCSPLPRRSRRSWWSFTLPSCATRLLIVAALFLTAVASLGAQPSYTAWEDQGIVYSAPSGGDAYYPSVLYSADGFGSGSPQFKMWTSDGAGGVYLVTSADGTTWSGPTGITGLGGDAHHVQVLYHASCFGAPSCGPGDPRYRIWYWDIDASIYGIDAIATAASTDGINWTNDQALSQDPTHQLVTGAPSGWNRGSYGPICLFYSAGASNSGANPWNYSFVMFYDGTDGGSEFAGLATSPDGFSWSAVSPDPVLQGSPAAAWDCSDTAYGTVLRDSAGFHFFYSGGGGDDGSGNCVDHPVHQGIGYASSSDGMTWTKSSANPIYHISQGVAYRNQRVYTPAVVADSFGKLWMYYSAQAQGTGEPKRIGLATNVSMQDRAEVPLFEPAGAMLLVAALICAGVWLLRRHA